MSSGPNGHTLDLTARVGVRYTRRGPWYFGVELRRDGRMTTVLFDDQSTKEVDRRYVYPETEARLIEWNESPRDAVHCEARGLAFAERCVANGFNLYQVFRHWRPTPWDAWEPIALTRPSTERLLHLDPSDATLSFNVGHDTTEDTGRFVVVEGTSEAGLSQHWRGHFLVVDRTDFNARWFEFTESVH